jgi:hypothetical protein
MRRKIILILLNQISSNLQKIHRDKKILKIFKYLTFLHIIRMHLAFQTKRFRKFSQKILYIIECICIQKQAWKVAVLKQQKIKYYTV